MHRLVRISLAGALGAAALALAAPSEAEACGGTFCDGGAPQPMPVDQNGENILFVKDGNTIEAHIQIQYDGDPERFGWVIPLQNEPEQIEPSSDPMFTNLLNGSVPQYGFSIQNDNCQAPSNDADQGAGFGDDGGGTGAGEAGDDDDDGVDILQQKRVGAFEVTVLTGTTVQAVADWLEENEYQWDEAAAPILQEYLDEGHLFGAVKLTAGAGVNEIHPIMFRFRSDEPCIPLRLTRIAAADDMAVRTFFLGDFRTVPRNYRHVEVNPLQIDWINQGTNYVDVITAAVDEEHAEGRAFVTEYAGPSEVVQQFGIRDPAWDAEAFTDIAPVSVIPTLMNQGLFLCGWDPNTGEDTCAGTHPLVDGMLAKYLPVPEGVEAYDFHNCPECYEELIDTELWNGTAFANEMQDTIIDPGEHALELLESNRYLTRLYTTISPHEMIEDPMFWENKMLDEVPNVRQATQRNLCNGDQIWTLPDGREVYIPIGGAWPDFDEEAPMEAKMAFAEIVEEVPEDGAPMQLAVKTEAIDAQLAEYNSNMGWNGATVPDGSEPSPSTSGGCGCRTTGNGPAALWVFGIGLGLAVARRRRRD